MATPSATTHAFCRGKAADDGSCLYTSFRDVDDISNTTDNQQLRSMVATYIREHKNLHSVVLQTGVHCVEDYCYKIEKGNLWGGEPEIRALTMLGRILICLVWIKPTAQDDICILNYGEDKNSFKECVYILYDEANKHYDPLCVINKQDPNEKMTIFPRDDKTIAALLSRFIREELHGNGSLQLDCQISPYELERSSNSISLNEDQQIENMLIPTASISLPSKRKLPAYDNLPLASMPEIHPLPRPSDKNYVPTKVAKLDHHKASEFDKNNTEPTTIEQFSETYIFDDESIFYDIQGVPTSEQQSIVEISEQVEEMRLEVEPASKFRGRASTDFKPKKALNRKGESAAPRPPRYFTDGNTRQYLNLLIPETYMADLRQGCLEISLVTREIDGYTYINPYFKFQVHPTDPKSPNLNPVYQFFDNTIESKPSSDNAFRQLQLKLVVVMHKNNELMQSDQPLEIFSSPKNNSNQTPITMTYDTYDEFKNAYHLHDIRFAITLWKKRVGEKVFSRHVDKRYISSISTEDKKYKNSYKLTVNS